VALKVDICKAFDTISWDFVLEVLETFWFCSTFRDWIASIFKSIRIFILLNGSTEGFFSCSRGVR